MSLVKGCMVKVARSAEAVVSPEGSTMGGIILCSLKQLLGESSFLQPVGMKASITCWLLVRCFLSQLFASRASWQTGQPERVRENKHQEQKLQSFYNWIS